MVYFPTRSHKILYGSTLFQTMISSGGGLGRQALKPRGRSSLESKLIHSIATYILRISGADEPIGLNN